MDAARRYRDGLIQPGPLAAGARGGAFGGILVPRPATYIDLLALYDLTRASKAWAWNSNDDLIEYASGVARTGTYTDDGDFGGLLIEEARTNLFLNSDSPATQTITIPSTGDYTISVHGSGSAAVAANTATGTGFGTASDGTDVTFNISATGTVDVTITGSPDYVQVEAGSAALSPIVTGGSTITRANDVAKITSIPWYNASEGTIKLTYRVPGYSEENQTIISLNDGSSDNRIEVFAHVVAVGEKARVQINSGGSTVAAGNTAVLSANTEHTIVATAKQDDFRSAVNGSQFFSDTGGNMPSGISNAFVGMNFEQGKFLNGWIKEARYYPRHMSQSEIEALSA